MYRKQWSDKKLFTNYLTDGIIVKINSRKYQLISENLMGVILIGQCLLSIEGIFNRSFAESSRHISCSLWHGWINSFVGNS